MDKYSTITTIDIFLARIAYSIQVLSPKHKAGYCSDSDRANYKGKGKKSAAKAAICGRWHGKENQKQPKISDCRIMNMNELSKGIEILTTHSAKCGGVCTLEGETMHSGLAVVLAASCSKCNQ